MHLWNFLCFKCTKITDRYPIIISINRPSNASLVRSGLRISELLALRVGDLTLNERSGEVVVRYGKGGVYRTVPLTATVRKAVRDYLETQPELKPDDLLWVGERGALTDRGSVLYLLKRYAFQARLDERLISPHILRHTFGRPFGRLVNTSMDVTRYLKRVFSPWRQREPSNSLLVSLQGT